MNVGFNLSRLLALARTRNGLLVIAGVLLALNAIRLVNGKYAEAIQRVESKQALLGQYRMSTRDLDGERARVQQLEARRTQFEKRLFPGTQEREVTSNMQIRLQEVMTKVGIIPEAISALPKPGGAKDKEAGNPYGEVLVKVRLGGNLDNFVKLLAALPKMDNLLVVDNVTIKPFKKDELKVFLEMRGYYRQPEPPKETGGKKEGGKHPGEPAKKGGTP